MEEEKGDMVKTKAGRVESSLKTRSCWKGISYESS
jgi:hypothetical protein